MSLFKNAEGGASRLAKSMHFDFPKEDMFASKSKFMEKASEKND